MFKLGPLIEHLEFEIILNQNLILLYFWCLMSYVDLYVRAMWVRHILVCHPNMWSQGQGNILNLNNNRKSSTKNHLQQCKSCSKSEINLLSSFTILKNCSSEHSAKIYEF